MNENTNEHLQSAQFWSHDTMSNGEEEYSAFFHDAGKNKAKIMHYHDFYEITFYLGSDSTIYIRNDERYEVHRGDIILCGMFEPHVIDCESNVRHERFIIGIDPDMMFSYCTNQCNLFSIFHSNKKNYPILHTTLWEFQKCMATIVGVKNLDLTYAREIGEKAIIHQLLARVYNELRKKGFEERMESKKSELSAQLVRYIETHLAEDITLDNLAKYTNYSVAHISRIFKEVTNNTLVGYINEKRMQKAQKLLREEKSIKEVAVEVGYNNYSYFYKTFKRKTGLSPEDYRKKYKNSKF